MKKFYKAINMDMTCIGFQFQYELNKEYKIEGELKMGENGFHFCNNLYALNAYYQIKKSRVFEISVNKDNMIYDEYNAKYCTDKITLVKELNKEEIKRWYADTCKVYANDKDWGIRKGVARNANTSVEILVKLSKDEDWCVRYWAKENLKSRGERYEKRI